MDDIRPKGSLTRRGFLKGGAGAMGALCLSGSFLSPRTAHPQLPQRGLLFPTRSPWFSPLPNAHLRCELCPRQCHIAPGARGRCRVRENRGGQGYTLAYGNPCLVQVDPVERTPFFHLLPGTRALSISTAGCPLECLFCEVWDMALVSPEDVHAYDLSPEKVVGHAKAVGARSVSCAFGEPVAFYEYMAAIATLAKRAGLMSLLHTSGYFAPKPLEAVLGALDAVNVDLKGFDPEFYRQMCGAELAPVLNTLKQLKAAGVHLEITNLILPTLNDDMAGIRDMCHWIRDELGAEVPIHFGRFYPLYKLTNLPPTPVSTLDRARTTALEAGLKFVYVARVTGHAGENTFCPGCGRKIIERMGFVVEEVHLQEGRCGFCGTAIPGRWARTASATGA